MITSKSSVDLAMMSCLRMEGDLVLKGFGRRGIVLQNSHVFFNQLPLFGDFLISLPFCRYYVVSFQNFTHNLWHIYNFKHKFNRSTSNLLKYGQQVQYVNFHGWSLSWFSLCRKYFFTTFVLISVLPPTFFATETYQSTLRPHKTGALPRVQQTFP